jgi:hypothetical protein
MCMREVSGSRGWDGWAVSDRPATALVSQSLVEIAPRPLLEHRASSQTSLDDAIHQSTSETLVTVLSSVV